MSNSPGPIPVWECFYREKELLYCPRPHPLIDPYFVREAINGESHTSLARKSDAGASVVTDDPEGDMLRELALAEPFVRDISPHRRKSLNMKPGGWRVAHLGTASAVPTLKRNVSATAMLIHPLGAESGDEPSMFLVDAGENTDDRLIRCNWCMTHGFRWIRAIFITHLHGDHIYGLPMLLASIGKYAQHRRRLALENGDDGSDPVVRIFGPYGTRGFVRTSLYWTNPVGVRFSVAELVPRVTDFRHLRGPTEGNGSCDMYVMESGSLDMKASSGLDLQKESPPPHPEEVRAEDVRVSDDGLWHVWEQGEGGTKAEVVAAPLRHRMPCFGYVFRESKVRESDSEDASRGPDVNASGKEAVHSVGNGSVQHEADDSLSFMIDKVKAKELGVHGTQLRVLRSGRPVTVSKTGLVVKPEDVALRNVEPSSFESSVRHDSKTTAANETSVFRQKVTILGDTCDSRAIAEAAMDSDLLVHEATFTDCEERPGLLCIALLVWLVSSEGRFAPGKSRLPISQVEDELGSVDAGGEGEDSVEEVELGADEDEDLANPNQLVREALLGYGDADANIVAALDFMEHDIRPMPSRVDHGPRAASSNALSGLRTEVENL